MPNEGTSEPYLFLTIEQSVEMYLMSYIVYAISDQKSILFEKTFGNDFIGLRGSGETVRD